MYALDWETGQGNIQCTDSDTPACETARRSKLASSLQHTDRIESLSEVLDLFGLPRVAAS